MANAAWFNEKLGEYITPRVRLAWVNVLTPKTKLILVPEDDPRQSVDVKNVEGFEGFEFGAEE